MIVTGGFERKGPERPNSPPGAGFGLFMPILYGDRGRQEVYNLAFLTILSEGLLRRSPE
jgi:hypothetical protein